MPQVLGIVVAIALLLARGTIAPGTVGDVEEAAKPDPATEVRRLIEAGRYADAETAARGQVATRSTGRDEDRLPLAEAQVLLAEAMWRGGRATEADALAAAQAALRTREESLPAGDPVIAEALHHLAHVLRSRGSFDEAKELFSRALQIREQAFGPAHPDVARSLSAIAMVDKALGNLTAAQAGYERAARILEAALGPDAPLLGDVLNNLANLLNLDGKTQEAQRLLERVLRIWEADLGPDHPKVATVLNNLALVHLDLGNLTAARPLLERSMAIRERTLGPQSSDLAQTLNNLGIVRWRLGDNAGARSLYERALAVRLEVLGPDHPDVAMVQHNFGYMLLRTGDLDAAQVMLERALATREKTFGPRHSLVADTLANLADLARARNDPGHAVVLARRALAIQEQVFGVDHPHLAVSLKNVASALEDLGDYAEARSSLERLVSLDERFLGPEHPATADAQASLARVVWRLGDTPRAVALALQAERSARQHFLRTALSLSESEALSFTAMRASGRDVALTVALLPGTRGPALDAVWEELVRSRALVLDEMAARAREIPLGRDPEQASRLVDLDAARTRLARLAVRGPDPERPAEYRARLEAAQQAAEAAERALVAGSAGYAESRDRLRVGLAQAAAALPPDAVLVSFQRFRRLPPVGSRPSGAAGPGEDTAWSYAALIHGPGTTPSRAVSLGTAQPIDDLVAAWQERAQIPPPSLRGAAALAEADYARAAMALRRAIWDPIEQRLAGATRVFVVPDGAIHRVSLAALPAGDGTFLVEARPLIHYLSAERDLVRGVRSRRSAGGALVLGGADFGVAPPSRTADRQGTEPAASPAAGCAGIAALRFPQLPGSSREAEEVAALLAPRFKEVAGHQGAALRLLTGTEASEAAFRALAPGRRMLHLATHAYFLAQECGGTPVQPLLRCGIVLAGANRRGDAAGEDGIVTGLEIASLDLAEAEWVVLSACDSGSGVVHAEEGILGLRRAFEQAGAGTLILSLWPVQDEAARAWMRALYRARLEGSGSAEAVRRASRETLAARRAAGSSTHPFYWGGFVAAGDWR